MWVDTHMHKDFFSLLLCLLFPFLAFQIWNRNFNVSLSMQISFLKVDFTSAIRHSTRIFSYTIKRDSFTNAILGLAN